MVHFKLMIVVNQMVVKRINVVKFMNVFRVQTKLQCNIYIQVCSLNIVQVYKYGAYYYIYNIPITDYIRQKRTMHEMNIFFYGDYSDLLDTLCLI